MRYDQSPFAGKRILITGNTGFKGSWLSIWLHLLGASVVGYALTDMESHELQALPHLTQIAGDVRDIDTLNRVFQECRPEVVFHLAAQPVVTDSYLRPRYTYEVNVLGTMNVLECIRQTPQTHLGIMVTSDKCYDNKEWIWGYRELDALGGHDPYSSSKGCCEILIASYRDSFFEAHKYHQHGKAIASVRAGNVIGGGDWSKDRIIPDAIRSLQATQDIIVRHPTAIRPWQHVLEPLYGYLLLTTKLMQDPIKYAGAWNFGPEDPIPISVEQVVETLIQLWGNGQWHLASSDQSTVHEASWLRLDITKAKWELGWAPQWDINTALQKTVEWYQAYDQTNKVALCVKQIQDYVPPSGNPLSY